MRKYRKYFIGFLALLLLFSFDYMKEAIYAMNKDDATVKVTFEETLNEEKTEADINLNIAYLESNVHIDKIINPDETEIIKEEKIVTSTYHVQENNTYNFKVQYTNLLTNEAKEEVFSYELKSLNLQEEIKTDTNTVESQTVENNILPNQPNANNSISRKSRATTYTTMAGMAFWNDNTKTALNPAVYSYNKPWEGSMIYWGDNAGTPMKWKILNTHETNYGQSNGVLIMHNDSMQLGSEKVKFNNSRETGVNYMGSSLESKIDEKFSSTLSEREQATTLVSTTIGETSIEDDIESLIYNYRIEGKKWFAPTIDTMTNENYGFPFSVEVNETREGGEEYWLSSSVMDYDNMVNYIGYYGDTTYYYVDQEYSMLAASQIKSDSILFVNNAVDGKGDGSVSKNLSAIGSGSGEYKLTLKDATQTFRLNNNTIEANSDFEVTVNYDKLGAGTSSSAIITDSTGENILYYGQISKFNEDDYINQQLTVSLPSDFFTNQYQLYLFTETNNGNLKTDYASDLVKVNVTEPARYTVTFDSKGGSAVSSQTVYINKKIATPTDPTKAGYLFFGWYQDIYYLNPWNFDSYNVTRNTTLYARWIPDNYIITYSGLEGASVSGNPSSYNTETSDITLNAPTKPGYTFKGWTYTGQTTPQLNVTIPKGSTGNKAYTANWEVTKYNVTFDSKGGSAVSSQTINYNNKATKPTDPTRNGYTFGGWYKDSALTTAWNFDTTVTGSMTLYAKWVQDPGNALNTEMAIWNDDTKDRLNPPAYSGDQLWIGNKLYWGNNGTKTPIKWRILNTNETEYGQSSGILIMTDDANQLSTTGTPFQSTSSSVYRGSKLEQLVNSFFNSYLSKEERNATLYSTRKADFTIPDKTFRYIDNLSDNRWFAPTGHMMYTESYGYPISSLPNKTRFFLNDVWLSSQYSAASNSAGYLRYDGMVAYQAVSNTYQYQILGASQLNPDSIMFVSKAEGGKTSGATGKDALTEINKNNNGEFKLTLKDTSQTINVTSVVVNSLNEATIKFNKTGDGSSLSAIVTDKTGNTILSYGRVADLAAGELNNQTATIQLPNNFFTSGYNLMVFTEIYNGDKKTDLASEMVNANPIMSFTVDFNSNGGSSIPNQIVVNGGLVTNPGSPNRDEHVFEGWFMDEDCTIKWNFNDTVEKPLTLYAKWTINKYTLTFDSKGGSAVSSQTINYNNKATKPTNPTRTGYTFGGWYKDSALTTAWDFNSNTVLTNTTLYAKWTIVPYTITYSGLEGASVSGNPSSYNVETSAIALNAPTKPGYTFKGWTYTGQTTPQLNVTIPKGSTGNKAYTANWDINKYTVTFDSKGGSAVSSQTINYNNKATKPTDPTRTGYTFGGWYKDSNLTTTWNFDSNTVLANTTLYAKWTINKYTVTFTSEGSTVSTQTVDYNNKATKPTDPTRTGYTFGGWYKDSALTTAWDFDTTVTSSMTLYAKWTPITYTITYTNLGGATDPKNPTTYTIESETITLKNPSATGYTFDGWTYEGETTPQLNVIIPKGSTGNKTYKMVWAVNKYTVYFDSRGGSTVSSQEIYYTNKATKPTDPTRTGYTFDGWYKDSALTTAWDFDTNKVYGNTTLYAKWTPITYTITYTSLGGATDPNNPTTYTIESEPITLKNPSATGYTFQGWRYDGQTTPQLSVTIPKGSTGNKTFDMMWTINKYTLTFDSRGGSAVSSQTIDYNTKATKPTNPTRTGYTFDGWYRDSALTTAWDFDTNKVYGNTTLYAKWIQNAGASLTANTALWNADTKTRLNPPLYSRNQPWVGSKLYWGNNAGIPLLWRILNTNETGFGQSNGVLIMIDKGRDFSTSGSIFSDNQSHIYTGSKLESFIDEKYSTYLNTKEQGATLNSSRTDNYNISGMEYNYKDDFSGKKWFAPTAKMVASDDYGYPNDAGINATRNFGDYIWLSSGYTMGSNVAGAVYSSGRLDKNYITNTSTLFASSATQLNPDSILMVSKAVGGKASGTTGKDALTTISNDADGEFKLTLKDTSQTISVTSGLVNDSNLATIKYNKTGEGTTLSAVITDSTGNNLVSYGRIASPASGTANNQTATVQLPSDFFTNNYKLKVFTEVYNGDKQTDYASAMVEVNLIKEYTVTFDSKGGSAVSSQTIENNKLVTLPTEPTRTGYTFDGWYKEEAYTTKWNFVSDKVTSSMTLYAKWTPITYTITYTILGSATDPNNPTTYTIESEPITLKNPTLTGWTFTGWTYEGQTIPQKSVTIPKGSTGNKTYTANWERNKYSVTFESNGGTAISPQTIDYDRVVTKPADPTRVGYTFDGWFKYSNFAWPWNFSTDYVKGDMTLYAKWNINKYTVTFKSRGGSEVSSQTVEFNKYATKPEDPTREGYIFAGWSNSYGFTSLFNFETTTIQTNTILSAIWIQDPSTTLKANTALWNADTKTRLNPPIYSGGDQPWVGSKLYWGNNAGTPMKWRILNTNETEYGQSSGMLMMHDDSSQFGAETTMFSDSSSAYTGSQLETFIDGKYSTSLHAKEQGATLSSSKNESYYVYAMSYQSIDNFSGKQWFAPTAKMLTTENYGYLSHYISDKTRTFGKESWTSSSSSQGVNIAAVASTIGAIGNGSKQVSTRYALGATQLNPDSILLVSKAVGGKASGTTGKDALTTISNNADGEFKLTLKDTSQTVSVTSGLVNDSNLATIKYNKTGVGTTLSAVITDSTGNNLVSYGRIASPASGTANNQTATVQLPSDFFTNNYKLKVFTEIYNGDKQTDYASDMVEVNLTREYTVTFDSKGGSAITSQNIEDGKKVTKPTDPSRDEYGFLGWFKDEACTTPWNFETDTITKSMTLYAKWNINQYQITFDSKGGTDVEGQLIDSGSNVAKPTDPTRTGYTFGGWYKEEAYTTPWNFETDVVTGEVTLYAKWTIILYTITYEGLNGATNTENPTEYNVETETITLTALTLEGYTFKGWTYEGQTIPQMSVTIPKGSTGNKTYTANWEINTYSVTFNSKEGTAVSPQTIEYNKFVTKPTDPTRTGYEFGGWYKEEAYTTPWDFETDVVTSEVTLYAKWNQIFKLTFDANTGVGSMDTIEFIIDDEVKLPKNTFTKVNYSFGGWNTKADGSGTSYDDEATISKMLDSDMTLYATWKTQVADIFIDIPSGISLMNNKEENVAMKEDSITIVKNPTDAAWYPDQDIQIRSNPSITLSNPENSFTYDIEVFKADGTKYTDATSPLVVLNVKDENRQTSKFTLKTPINYSKPKGTYSGSMNFIIEFIPKP